MVYKEINRRGGFDGLTALIYIAIVLFGWVNIFAAVYDPSGLKPLFDFSMNSTKQIMFIGTAILLIIIILTIDYRTFDTFAYLIYIAAALLLVVVLFTAREINGSRSWINLPGGFGLQPAEFAKFATALALAKFMSTPTTKSNKNEFQMILGAIIGLPILLILLQGDDGSALVFSAFIFVLYREGIIPHWILFSIIGTAILFILALSIVNLMYLILPVLTITLVFIIFSRKNYKHLWLTLSIATLVIFFVFSAKYIFTNVLKPHQKARILVLIEPEAYSKGDAVRYNLEQSKIAIGSGGLWGKGFLEGTQTKLDFVPEQSTDFIFCTVGEEHGWVGSFALVLLFMLLLYRIILIAERQKDKFARIYGYSVASIIFFHFAVNIAMTIGLFPVVGIPLPFVSYGGSSLWAFTILLFILLKLDAHREQQVERK